jgi:ABC-2 type transport system ATP-binding protein
MLLALEIQNLSKCYRGHTIGPNLRPSKKIVALDRVNLTVSLGETVALVGPNGSGKTTLLKCIADLILPDVGSVTFFGVPTEKRGPEQKSWVSFMAGDEKSFYWRLTGRQNLEFFAALYNLPSKSARERYTDLSIRLGLEDLDKMFQEYSSGHRQRLAMIRTVLSLAHAGRFRHSPAPTNANVMFFHKFIVILLKK